MPRGEYRGGLYDIGFDRPEAHAIRKDGSMYYAFYATQWNGKITLRGLSDRAYRRRLCGWQGNSGTARGPVATFDVKFEKHLLLEAKPE